MIISNRSQASFAIFFILEGNGIQINILFISEEVTIQPITYIYHKSGSVFKSFTYLYHLTRNCKSRVDLMRIITNNAVSMPKHFMIKIGIAGTFTSDDLKLISKRTGKDLFYNSITLLK